MKKIILSLVLIFFLIILISLIKFYQPTKQNQLINQRDKKCQVDSDCTRIMTKCSCDCGEAINKKFFKKYQKKFKDRCDNYHGPYCKMKCNKIHCLNGYCQ